MSHPEPPVPNLIAEALRLAENAIGDRIMVATVEGLNGNEVYISRTGHPADAASYPKSASYTATPGDIVLMVRAGHSWIVLCAVISN